MSLQRLEVTPFTGIIREIIQNRSSGQLVIVRGQLRRTLYWAHGEVAMVAPSSAAESFWAYLVHQGHLSAEDAAQHSDVPALEVVPHFHSLGQFDSTKRNSLLREWLSALFLPLFSLEDGTAVFTDEEAIDPDKRIFFQSVAPLVVDGVRSISSGLILRNSLGDMKQTMAIDDKAPFSIDTIPFKENEQRIANDFREPQSIEAFLRNHGSDSGTAARVVIVLLTLGIIDVQRERSNVMQPLQDDPQQDLQVLATLGSSDQRSLRAFAFSRQIDKLDYYKLLDMPRGATAARIVEQYEKLKVEYEPSKYPPVIRNAMTDIQKALDRAMQTLSNASSRQQYDRMLSRGTSEGMSVEQMMARRQIAYSNFEKAKELTILGDYYGAIVLLKQTVHFDPSSAEAWHLLGSCQERNPKWRRDAAVSYQKALAADPDFVEAMLSLGDLYRMQGLTSRAQNFYEDILRIDPDHALAKTRLKELKK